MTTTTPINTAILFYLLVLLTHTPYLCHAGLCEDNPDICRLYTGTYSDHDSKVKKWWAFEPIGEYACPKEGCPLYVWVDGTEQEPFQPESDQVYMIEMLKRGFVSVNMEYDSNVRDYASGCYGKFWDAGGFDDKSREIFSGAVSDSIVTQLCDKPETKLANCDLGIATHGYSQGAHIADLAGNHDPRVSATLLFANGNDNMVIPWADDVYCVNYDKLALPPERRRSIVGENDEFFGLRYGGVLKQQIETSGYDCRRDRKGNIRADDHWDCLTKTIEGCCGYISGECPKKCPDEVEDTYIGGGATIEDTAGYYIISGEEYCKNYGCDPSEYAKHNFFQEFSEESDFMSSNTVWGAPQNLDWLARIAKKTPAVMSARNFVEADVIVAKK